MWVVPSHRPPCRSRLWYVLDRQLLNGSSHRHQNRRLCSRPHSNESVIFWDSYFSSYGEFVEFSLTFTAAVSAVAVFQRVHYTKIRDAGCIRLQPLRCEPSECGSAHYTKIGTQVVFDCSRCGVSRQNAGQHIYTTKIDGVVCPPNISETVTGRLMKLAHRQSIAWTTIKLISEKNLLSIFSILVKTI